MMNSFTTDSFEFIDFTEMNGALTRQVWGCRNLPEIRKWMVNTESISYETHLQFINGLRNKSNAKYYYAVLQNGSFVGSVNIHFEDEGVAERGIYIHPDYWGKGLAKKICREFYFYLCNNMGIKNITTKVMNDNVGSNALERSLGALKTFEDERMCYYNCDLKDY